MFTKGIGWAIVAVLAAGIAWWLIDPIGFANNPLLVSLRNVGSRSSEFLENLLAHR